MSRRPGLVFILWPRVLAIGQACMHAPETERSCMHGRASFALGRRLIGPICMSEVTTGGPTADLFVSPRSEAAIFVSSPLLLVSRLALQYVSSSLHTRCGQLNGRKEAEMDDQSRREDITCHIVDDRLEHLRFLVWTYGPFSTDLAQSQIELRFFFFFARLFLFRGQVQFNQI